MTLWLIGLMGSGKTTAGRMAAHSLGIGFVDTDEEVEAMSGSAIRSLWDSRGEDGFRALEEQVVERVSGAAAIVATGGGVVLREANRARMRETGPVVWLQAPVDVIVQRLRDVSARPLLAGVSSPANELERLLEERLGLYEECADHRIDTGGLTAAAVAERIVALWPS